MNWEKLGSPARATFKNPNSLCQMGKSSKYSLRPTNTQKIPILNLWMNWEKFCPNLRFTVENKIGNLPTQNKAAHVSNLTYNE